MAWLTRMPWRLLVDHAPTIVDAARRIYVGSRTAEPRAARDRGIGHEALQRAVDELEAREAQHAALLDALAKQVHDLTTAVDVLRARVRWAWIGAAVAVALALTAAFLRR